MFISSNLLYSVGYIVTLEIRDGKGNARILHSFLQQIELDSRLNEGEGIEIVAKFCFSVLNAVV